MKIFKRSPSWIFSQKNTLNDSPYTLDIYQLNKNNSKTVVLLHLFFKKLFNLKRIIDNIKIYPVLYRSQLNSNKLTKPTTKDGEKERTRKENGNKNREEKKNYREYQNLYFELAGKRTIYFQLHDMTLNRSRVRIASQSSSKCQIPVLLVVPGPAVVEEWLRRFGSVLGLWISLGWALFGIRFVVSWTVAWSTVARVINYR